MKKLTHFLIVLLLLGFINYVKAQPTNDWEGDDPDNPTDWYVAENWSFNQIPTEDHFVKIDGTISPQPFIGGGDASCKSLTFVNDATLTQGGGVTSPSYLNVFGTLNTDGGTFIQGEYAKLNFVGTELAFWGDPEGNDDYRSVSIDKTNSTDVVTLYTNIIKVGHLDIDNGIFEIEGDYTLKIGQAVSTTSLNVSEGGRLDLTAGQTIETTGDIWFENLSQASIEGGDIICEGDFIIFEVNDVDVTITGGTVTMSGDNPQSILFTHDYTKLYDLVIAKSSGSICEIWGATEALHLSNNLTINGGTLDCHNHDIYIGGNWENNALPAGTGFNAGTNTVIFNGANDADIKSNETFYNLTLEKDWEYMITMPIVQIGDYKEVNVDNDIDIISGTLKMKPGARLEVGKNLGIEDNGGLDAGEIGDEINIFVGGNWSIHAIMGVGYISGSETVTFNGNEDQSIGYSGWPFDIYFGNLEIDKTGGHIFNINTPIIVTYDCNISHGDGGNLAYSLAVWGNFTISEGDWGGVII